MGLGRPLVAGPQTPILSKPGKRSFDHPALAAETGAVGCHSFCNRRPDLLAAECLPMRFRVVAAVGEQHAGRLRGLPTTPRVGGIASTSGSSCVTSCALAIGDQVVLAAEFAPVNGAGAGLLAPKSARSEAESRRPPWRGLCVQRRGAARGGAREVPGTHLPVAAP